MSKLVGPKWENRYYLWTRKQRDAVYKGLKKSGVKFYLSNKKIGPYYMLLVIKDYEIKTDEVLRKVLSNL